MRFPVQFYLVAMLFVVFDIESVSIYAWAVAARAAGWAGYVEVMVFIAFLVGGPFAIEAVSVYLVSYAVMTLGAFAVITLLPPPNATRDADLVEDYHGLFWLRPGLSLPFAAALLSLAGIPLTIGFIAKFYAVASGVEGHHGVLLGTLVAGSIVGLYYYLRIVVAMAAPLIEVRARAESHDHGKPLGNAVLAALVLLLIGLGAYPAPLLTLIRATASMVAR